MKGLVEELDLEFSSFDTTYSVIIRGKKIPYAEYLITRNEFIEFVRTKREEYERDKREQGLVFTKFIDFLNHYTKQSYLRKIVDYAEFIEWQDHPVDYAIDVYPLENILPPLPKKYHAVKDSYNQLTDRLVEIVGRDRIRLNHYVRSIDNMLDTWIIKSDSPNTILKAKHLVVATDQGIIKAFKKGESNNIKCMELLRKIYQSIKPNPLCRYFTVHNNLSHLIYSYVKFVDTPLNKMIKISDKVLMSAYTDGVKADELRDCALRLNKENTPKKVLQIIKRMMDNTGLSELNMEVDTPSEFLMMYWSHGSHIWIINKDQAESLLNELSSNYPIDLVGEAVSFVQGWGEGAIETAFERFDARFSSE
jgi:hypothetical protein